jgi:hypothetical protein
LDDSSALKLSWIESSDPAKVLYYEGDAFEAHITSGVRDVNYVVVCDSKRIVASGKVPDSNRISLQIQNGMSGVCMLYVYKIENPKAKLDMWLFMAETNACPSTVSFEGKLIFIEIISANIFRFRNQRCCQ